MKLALHPRAPQTLADQLFAAAVEFPCGGGKVRLMPHTFPVGAVLHLLWGGQSCPQPPFRRLFREVSEPSPGKGRLKAGCRQDWLPHNLGGMVSRIKKYATSCKVRGGRQ